MQVEGVLMLEAAGTEVLLDLMCSLVVDEAANVFDGYIVPGGVVACEEKKHVWRGFAGWICVEGKVHPPNRIDLWKYCCCSRSEESV